MRALLCLVVVVATLTLLGMAQESSTSNNAPRPSLPNCDAARVSYEPVNASAFNAQLASRIQIEAIHESIGEQDREPSPQRTRWISFLKPTYAAGGPYTTSIYIGEVNDDPTLKLIIRKNVGVEIRWLNEKLLYGSVGWGRIVSTDFIFDVEKKKFIYEEMENVGELVTACK